MRALHLAELAPICPRCRTSGSAHRLAVALSCEMRGDVLMDGILTCPNAACRQEFPVVGGLPVLVPDVRTFVQEALFHLMIRDDLSPEIESLLGDAAGGGSGFDAVRQQQSSYAWDHWSEFDPDTSEGQGDRQGPSAAIACLDAGLAVMGPLPVGPVLDLGCATGRSSFHLAARLGRAVAGIDLNVPLMRIARRVLDEGMVRYPLRRGGVVYDRREFPLRPDGAGLVDFWIGNALSLPVADDGAAAVVALNLLDCLSSPAEGLVEIARVLRPGGKAVLACPFDWTPSVTPMEGWIGGHSQRSALRGAPEAVFDHLLAEAVPMLRVIAPPRDMPWRVRLHDRAMMDYRTYLIVLEKTEAAP